MTDEELKKELDAEISRVAERYPEVSFAKLSRIAVHFAKWQAEQDNYDTIFHKGMMYYRKQMMEEAVEGYIERDLGGQLILGRSNSPAGDEFMLLDSSLFPSIKPGQSCNVKLLIIQDKEEK